MEKKVTKLSVWERDITKEVVGVLAVFGLVVSSLVATTNVAALGVQAQIGFAQYGDSAMQAAAVAMGGDAIPTSVSVPILPPPPASGQMGASMMPGMASSTPGMYCPKIVRTVIRGSQDASSTQDVAELQRFIASRYHLNDQDVVTGYFGSTTQLYLEKFQQSQGIPPAPSVGPLTRAAIATLCGGTMPANPQGNMQNSPMMTASSSSTRGQMPPPPMPQSTGQGENPGAMGSSTSGMPHIYHGGTNLPPMLPPPPMPQASSSNSNGAAVIEAIGEIGDGYSKLLQASISLLGL